MGQYWNVAGSSGGLAVSSPSQVSILSFNPKIFGLVGPNGSGKTTLTNAITGFYPPNVGTVRLGGKDITGTAPHKVATLGVARTFQNLPCSTG